MERPDNHSVSAEHAPLREKASNTFATTQWSLVLAAGNSNPAGAAVALEHLCTKYWYPIYAFVRRRGAQFHEAQDLTQSFFVHLLEKQTLRQADRQKGRFRSFLLASLTNFLNNEWDKRQALKRGGQRQIISLDETAADERYRLEPVEATTPEKLFERQWALTLLENVLARLKQEYEAAGKGATFARLEPLITGEVGPGVYAEIASVLAMKEETVRMALSRLRRRFGELLRNEIAQTVVVPAEVDDEIRHLFAAVFRDG